MKVLCLDTSPITETTGFVDKLFDCLTTKNYLGNPLAKEVPKEDTKLHVLKQEAVEVRACVELASCRILSVVLCCSL